MAIIQKELPCPFCKTRGFTLNAFVKDDYEPGFDSDNATRRALSVSCVGYGRDILHVEQAVEAQHGSSAFLEFSVGE